MNVNKKFQQNPKLMVFLPLLYIVWSDEILTEEECKTMEAFINAQNWLAKDEKEYLKSLLRPDAPPAPKELVEWKSTIEHILKKEPEQNSLAEAGIRLARYHANGNLAEDFEDYKPALATLEAKLGIISAEAVYKFRQGHVTLTTQHLTKPSFSVRELQKILDGSDAELIQKLKHLLCEPAFDRVPETYSDAYREKVLQWCKILAEKGYGAIAYPEQYGGENDMEGYFTVMETLSYHDLSMVIKFGVQFGLWGMSILSLGTAHHHKKYLKAIGQLDLPGCFAMTETRHGSNVKGLETTATYDHKNHSFTIHTPHEKACKEYIGNAAMHARMATVFAQLHIDGRAYGVNAFIVPLRDEKGYLLPGIRIEDNGRKLGLDGVDNGKIWFDNVSIPKENMLNRFADVTRAGTFESPIASDKRRFFTMLGTLVGGRIGIPRSALAAAKSGLTIAIQYSDQRRQFGPEGGEEVPILNYRMHQRRLMPLLANAFALHFALRYVTRRFIDKTEAQAQETEALAAGLKATTTRFTTDALQECREACGGKGYLWENRIPILKNDTDVYTTFEGDNTVLMQLVAKSRLTAFRRQFEDMNMFTVINYLAEQTKISLTAKNPIVIRNTTESHLLDPDFHLQAFRYREQDILNSVAQRLKRHIDDEMDSFDAFNVAQHHLINTAQAYIDRIVLEQFVQQVENTQDAGCKTVLKKLCTLYALAQIEKNKGWYLEQNYMEGVKTKAIRKMVNQLCWEIRQDAVPLVEAFGIPDKLLAADIAG